MSTKIDYKRLLKEVLGIQLVWECGIPYMSEWAKEGITAEEKEAIFLLLDEYCEEHDYPEQDHRLQDTEDPDDELCRMFWKDAIDEDGNLIKDE
jgi:hypothetical protein